MHSIRKAASGAVLLFVAGIAFVPLFAAAPHPQPLDFAALFDKTEVMVPMRDGVKLHTEFYTPKNASQPLPILLTRTPYGIADPDGGISPMIYRYAAMVPDGYIFAFQDIRGRYGSQGKFVMLRPLHDPSDPKGVDESTDTYDTIDWLVKNVPNNNGRVGLDGTSYDGFLVTMGTIHPHPALKAVSEQACMGDTWLGDDFFHNGAFRLSYAFEYTALMESSNENYSFPFDRFDVFDFFLRLGALSNVNAMYFHGKLPTWNEFVANPSYDDFWKRRAIAYGLKQATVPDLNVAGWWDQEDFYGPMSTYARLEKSDSKHLNYLVAGPWNHGGWGHGSGKSLGEIPFGSDTSVYFRQKIEAPWFAYWLKDTGALPLKEALLFQTGSDTWIQYDSWPPRQEQTKSLYFQADGKLSF
ncbi:MAG: CocE/NonD family hydrolase, partial [Candidatus Acidiferrum sp.]